MTDDERAELVAEIRLLTASMLKLRLYRIDWTTPEAAEPDVLLRILPTHFRWQLDLERRGILFASGPLFAEDGSPTRFGMTIVRAESFASAAELAATEPYVLAGQRTFEVRGWDFNEGSLNVRVEVGRGAFSVA